MGREGKNERNKKSSARWWKEEEELSELRRNEIYFKWRVEMKKSGDWHMMRPTKRVRKGVGEEIEDEKKRRKRCSDMSREKGRYRKGSW